MDNQYPNLAQTNDSPPPPPPLEDATLTAIHNAFLLGWSIMELKSRVQIAACNMALDCILVTPPKPADPPGNQPLQTTPGTERQQPDLIDALVENIVLKGVPYTVADGSQSISAKAQPLSTELRDNIWLTSMMRELFRRIARRHLQRFPTSDTSNTMYDINPPIQANPTPSDFPYLYLYPGKFDYANVGISMMKPDDIVSSFVVSSFVQNFRLYDVTRRALNCLTLLWTTPDDALTPETIACYQKRLVPEVLAAPSVATAPTGSGNDDDQPALEEDSCDDLPVPPDPQVKQAIKTLSSLVIRLLEAWDGFLRESFYCDTGAPTSEIELIAYEAGRSLAALSWGVSVALVPLENSLQRTCEQQQNLDPALAKILTEKVRATWLNVFNLRDIDTLQRRISALSKALDTMPDNAGKNTNQPDTSTPPPDFRMPGQAVQAVNSSLDYWQRAVTQMCRPASPTTIVKPVLTPIPATSAPQAGDGEPLLPLNWGTSATALRLALIKQSYLWRALLVGQRDVQSFSIDRVTQKMLNDFMQELEQAAGNEFQRIRKRSLTVFVLIIALSVVVLGLVITAAFVPQIGKLNTGQINNPLTLLVLLWGGVAAFVSSLMGKMGDVLSRFGPAGTAVSESFERGYQRILVEFEYLNHAVAVTSPLFEFFALADFTMIVENPDGKQIVTAIKDGYDFLVYVFWTKQDREDEIKQVVRAAFGPIGAFVGTELGLEQAQRKGINRYMSRFREKNPPVMLQNTSS